MKAKRIGLVAGFAAAAVAAGSLAFLSPTDSDAAEDSDADATQCSPAQPANLGGDLGTHDPALWAGCDGEDWYVFATGDGRVGDGNIPIRRSTDEGETWEYVGTVWDTKPAWLTQEINGVDNLWAPEIYHDSGTYYMYYSASTFGNQRSLIGLATNTTLDPADPDYEWVDQGAVFQSYEGDPYNAIDAGIVAGPDGTHYMTFGSWWTGIYIVELDWPSGTVASGASPTHIAGRGGSGIEAPFITEHDGMYYLFTSWDVCCDGANSTYNIRVGRSESPTGPYVDADGVALTDGGGTLVLAGHGDFVATGGQSVHRGLMAYHSYHQNGSFSLGIEQIEWNADGWPVLNGS